MRIRIALLLATSLAVVSASAQDAPVRDPQAAALLARAMAAMGGSDDQVALNFEFRRTNSVSETSLKQAINHTITFHELAEAYAKVEGNKPYAAAHQEAIVRESKLRVQRPYLREYNPGSGPGDNFIIKK